MAEKACIKRLQKEYRALCKVLLLSSLSLSLLLLIFFCLGDIYDMFCFLAFRNQSPMLLLVLPQMTFSSGVSLLYLLLFLFIIFFVYVSHTWSLVISITRFFFMLLGSGICEPRNITMKQGVTIMRLYRTWNTIIFLCFVSTLISQLLTKSWTIDVNLTDYVLEGSDGTPFAGHNLLLSEASC